MIKHISTVGVYVEDQQKALAFWTEKVGFIVYANFPMGPKATWLEVGPENAQTRLVLYPKAMMKNWAELKPSIVFECDDIYKLYEDLQAKGVDVDKPNEMEFGIFTFFRDEDGNQFGLKQPK
ncbi:VOC family protein [Brevibacillus laterosporus]|uniref:VOC family protein n=1 Tax=Brevibacillus laterosporus TaxID=1465 RepID=UPI002650F8F6|nr:VOC family protein [Brevibacillus laterosporus]MDN9009029.1 VOC family protein [Brevibacillus laterosporus]MDO0942482.1 VOC family protein [Brevibacillus laterosporus]